MSSWGHWPSDKLLYPKVTFNGTEMFKLLWMCGIYWASCCGLWNVCSNNIQKSHWNSKTTTVQWSNRPTGVPFLTCISPPTIYETYMILIKSMCFHTSISLTVSFWFICGMYCSVVVWFRCVCIWMRGTRGTTILLFPLCPCLCLPFRVYLALSAIEEQKHCTGSIMRALCRCSLISWLMGFVV